jgi:hypothetical protein
VITFIFQDKVKTQLTVEDLVHCEKIGENDLFNDISDSANDTRQTTKVRR